MFKISNGFPKYSRALIQENTYVRVTGKIIEGDGTKETGRESARRTYESIIEKQMGKARVRSAWDRVRNWRTYTQEAKKGLMRRLVHHMPALWLSARGSC